MEQLNEDRKIIRELAQEYREIALSPRQKTLREEWRAHNSLKKTRPLIVCSWDEGSNLAGILFANDLKCHDPELRGQELFFRNSIFHNRMGDDWLYEPYITVNAVRKKPLKGSWGYDTVFHRIDQAFISEPFVLEEADIAKLERVDHIIDEEKTAQKRAFFEDIYDGILDVCVNRRPIYSAFGYNDLSTSLAEILGFENMMCEMIEEPELVHARYTARTISRITTGRAPAWSSSIPPKERWLFRKTV